MAKTRARDINEQQQKAIIEGRKQGRTHEQLAQQFGVSKSTITKFLKRWKIQGGYVKKMKTGRPRCTTSVVDRNILRTARSNPRLTAPDIMKEIFTVGESIRTDRTSSSTGRRTTWTTTREETTYFRKEPESANRMGKSTS